jgi:hypothetical protein
LTFGLASLVAVSGVQGSPLRHLAREAATRVEDPMQAYFEHALRVHSLHVHVPKLLRELRAENGLLPETPFVDYLRWRWSLDPLRFARFHPHTAALLKVDDQVRALLGLPTPPTISPPTPTVPPLISASLPPRPFNPTPQFVNPPPVPEPAMGWVAAVLVAAAAVWRHRAQNR